MRLPVACYFLKHNKPLIQKFLVFEGHFMYLSAITHFEDVHFPSLHLLNRTNTNVKERIFIVVLPCIKARIKECDETFLPAGLLQKHFAAS